MSNKGQTTILFTLMISILFIFTLTALEVERIYTSKVKIRSVVHSTCTNVMADYDADLFERYHLMFMDPTYGTDSEAALEEKAEDYLLTSLNSKKGGNLYKFSVQEIAAVDFQSILDNNMELFKKQIVEYEKLAGVPKRAKNLYQNIKNKDNKMKEAAKETEINGVEVDSEGNSEKEKIDIEVKDPRETLEDVLDSGTLSFVLPEGKSISRKKYNFKDSPSKEYQEQKEKEKNHSFQDISLLKKFINKKAEEKFCSFEERIATLDYYTSHFSNACYPNENEKIQCEAEYILKGEESDYENLEGVVNDILWMRMPINYAYLLTDTTKKSEALTLATAICLATSTEALIEVVKYLLLGCWAYGESLYEVKMLLSGESIPFIKTKQSWYTDLENPGIGMGRYTGENALQYEDFLIILLAQKSDKKMEVCYARMLDVIQNNLQKRNPDFKIKNCIGRLKLQGKIHTNSLFLKKDEDIYNYYFEEEIAY